jgi:hypothetical protein
MYQYAMLNNITYPFKVKVTQNETLDYGIPTIFLLEEKLVAPLIETPNVDKCNRRQTRKAKS